MSEPILPVVESFLNFLSQDNPQEIFTFALFDKHSEKPLPGKHTEFASVVDIGTLFDGISDDDFSLHVCLNQTSHKGRKNKDVTACRVFCVDLDSWTTLEEIKEITATYKPGMIVRSSVEVLSDNISPEEAVYEKARSKYHLYWQIEYGSSSLDVWKDIQLGLSYIFKGDNSLASLSHPIRVPGVERYLKDRILTYTPEIVYLEEEPTPYSPEKLFELIPSLKPSIVAAKKLKKEIGRKEALLFDALSKPDRKTGKVNLSEIVVLNGRNKTLYRMCERFIKANPHFTQDEYYDYALHVNNAFEIPLEEAEFRKTIQSAFDRTETGNNGESGEGSLVDVDPEEIAGVGTDDSSSGSGVELVERESYEYDYSTPHLKENRFTDVSMVERIYQRFALLMARTEQGLFAFDKKDSLWKKQTNDDTTLLFEFFNECVQDVLTDKRFIQELCTTANGDMSISKLRKAQEKFLNSKMFKSVASVILTNRDRRVPKKYMADFDASRGILFVKNGRLDLYSGELAPAEASDYLMHQAPVMWDAEAECPNWIKFLGEVFEEADDPQSMIDFMQELFGYSLSGEIGEQKIFCHYGSGANGKSKVLSALRLLGGDLSTYVDPDDFSKIQGGYSKAFERFGAKAEGKRCVIVDDLETASIWNESLVKAVTASHFRARGEYEKSREAVNRGKFHLGLNVAPSPQAENFGILRRLCFIPYTRRFAPSSGSSNKIDAMIKEELSGILRWAQIGFVRYSERTHLCYPAETEAAIEEYKEETFVVERILKELFVPDENEFVFSSDAHSIVTDYLIAEGEHKRISPEELSTSIRNTFRLKPEKKWNPERQNMFKGFKLKKNHDTSVLNSLLKVD